MWSESQRLCTIHFELVFPTYIALSLFDDLHNDLFSDEDAFESQRLLQGYDNLTLAVDRALWDLSREARQSPDVRAVIEQQDPKDVTEALSAGAEGQAFLKKLDAFIGQHGKRGALWGICHTSWVEDATPILRILQEFIGQEGDPAQDLLARGVERDAAIAAVREKLQGYPSAVRDEFEALLKAASCALVLSEDHGYWLDFQTTYRVRQVVVKLGKRLAEAGVIDAMNDVFFLQKAEIEAAAGAADASDQKALVMERKKGLAHFSSIKPPHFIGTDYGPPPPGLLSRAFGTPPEPSNAPDTLGGHAGSPGKVQGIARIIRSLDDAEKLHLGEILVAETTARRGHPCSQRLAPSSPIRAGFSVTAPLSPVSIGSPPLSAPVWQRR